MAEPQDSPAAASASPAAPPSHPGQRLRSAREARGWTLSHVSVLLKISERRLEAFEAGQWDAVGDATFVRGLARSLCRHLSVPVDDVLPGLPSAGSVEVPRALPPREGAARAGAMRPSVIERPGQRRLAQPVVVLVLLILGAAAVLALLPSRWEFETSVSSEPAPMPAAPVASSASMPAAAAASDAAAAPGSDPASGPSAPAPAPAPAPSPAPAPAPAHAPAPAPATSPAPTPRAESALTVRATESSWVSVRDAQGQTLLSRIVQPGEVVQLDGARPLTVRVGNVAGTELTWAGRAVDLRALQRNNVATLDLP